MALSMNWVLLVGVLIKRGLLFLGSILGTPDFWKLPYLWGAALGLIGFYMDFAFS